MSNYEQEQQFLAQFGSVDDSYFDILSPTFQPCEEDIRRLLNLQSYNSSHLTESNKGRKHIFPPSSLEILYKYRSRFRRLNGKKIAVSSYKVEDIPMNSSRLSTDGIIQLAAEKFIEYTSHSLHQKSSLSGLPDENTRDVQLVMHLLAAAEKVGEKQHDRASKLLYKCEKLSFSKGNPVQRLVHYFAEALYEKIDRETGRITPKGLGKKQFLDENLLMTPNPTMLAFHKLLPLSHVTQFAGIQAIIEHVGEARKVHIIDLDICNGVQFTILMQALEGQLDRLKITSVSIRSKPLIQETGRRLENFTKSLGLSFSFHIVMVEDILELNKSLFEVGADEILAVYAAYVFKNMIRMPDRLQLLMELIRSVSPCVMVVTEVEASDNSPFFVNRFVEALFFYGAFFDAMGDCMKNDESNRTVAESKIFSPAIRNIVAAEGEERKIRHVSIDVWRAFFARFGMAEIELSMSSIYQANLLLKKFTSGGSCTLNMDGKSLIIGWKGTPLNSLSVWRFQ